MTNQNTNNSQREGSTSNAQVGRDFEGKAKIFFEKKGILLEKDFSIRIGTANEKKIHKFDLGSEERKIIVECKTHTWRRGNNIPSAKMTTWDQAMFYFFLAPNYYKKIFFCLKDYSEKRKETLAEYYTRTHYNLIPTGVEIWEYCEEQKTASNVFPLPKI